LRELRTRADSYRSLPDLDFEDVCALNGEQTDQSAPNAG
jgi:hypothetical protein